MMKIYCTALTGMTCSLPKSVSVRYRASDSNKKLINITFPIGFTYSVIAPYMPYRFTNAGLCLICSKSGLFSLILFHPQHVYGVSNEVGTFQTTVSLGTKSGR